MSVPVIYGLSRNQAEDHVNAVGISLASAEEIISLSAREITSASINVKDQDGLMSMYLGTTSRHMACLTCGKNDQGCPGHQGHHLLPMPVYHMGCIGTLLKTLRMVCFFCSRYRGATNVGNGFGKVFSGFKAPRQCQYCGGTQPEFGKAEEGIVMSWQDGLEYECDEEREFCTRQFTVLDARSIVDAISDDDARAMGFDAPRSHPRNFILDVLLITTVVVRPSISVSEGTRARGHDDLTLKLQDIVRRSHEVSCHLREKGLDCTSGVLLQYSQQPDMPADEIREWPGQLYDLWCRLQNEVAVYMDNSHRLHRCPVPRATPQHKSITCKLKGKDGRIRGNLMGKRVNFCARTVISPDSYIGVDELGVPESIALSLTVPETVCCLNRDRLAQCVQRGWKTAGGAECIITAERKVYQLEFKRGSPPELQDGDVVERYMHDGDVVVFNRQPSLHRNSLMGHRVRIMPGLTFRLNLSCAGPYNADFDGDEMNMHLPQNPIAIAEAKYLMSVDRHIMSPQSNRPVMGIVQDSLLGCYLLTARDVLFSRTEISQHMMRCSSMQCSDLTEPVVLYPQELWTGKQLLQLALAPVSIVRGDVLGDDMCLFRDDLLEETVYIRDGMLLMGRLRKNILGPSLGGLIHRTWLDVSAKAAATMMNDIQQVTNSWLVKVGFSVGISDCVIAPDTDTAVHGAINSSLSHVLSIQRTLCGADSVHTDMLLTPGTISRIEDSVMSILLKILSKVVDIVQSEHTHKNTQNAILSMITAGSKGNVVNLSQIMGCVGQNCVQGARPCQSKATGRTLPCYPHGDMSITGRGFVNNPYSHGLDPEEFFFHAMGGREGLVDTAVKTSTTGYIQRRMVKAAESVCVAMDRTLRDNSGRILEFVVGCDGMDPMRLEIVGIPEVMWSDTALRRHVHVGGRIHTLDWDETRDAPVLQREYDMLILARDRLRRERIVSTGLTMGDTSETMVRLPFDCSTVIRDVAQEHGRGSNSLTDVTCHQVHDALGQFEATMRSTLPDCSLYSVIFHMRLHLCCSRLIHTHRLNGEALRNLFDTLERRWRLALSSHGDMVGCVAAQSIGEPCTQLSAAADTPVLVRVDGGSPFSTPIGPLVDAYLPPLLSSDQHDVASVIGLGCCGVSPTEAVTWTNVSHVSRHPANGDMLTVSTASERSLTMTASHSFLVRSGNRVVPRPGRDLVVGDCLPVVKTLPCGEAALPTPPRTACPPWSWEMGHRAGHLVSLPRQKRRGANDDDDDDDDLQRMETWEYEQFGYPWGEKKLPGWILDAPESYVSGFLCGYLLYEGDVLGASGNYQLCCRSETEEITMMLCLMFARFGIVTYVREELRGGLEDPEVMVRRLHYERSQEARAYAPLHRIVIPSEFAEALLTLLHYDRILEPKPRAEFRTLPISKVEAVARDWLDDSTDTSQDHACVPGMTHVLMELGHETTSNDRVTVATLLRCRGRAVTHGAPDRLLRELDQAIAADVWWDPIVLIEVERDVKRMVYDFTVDQKLQSFMLSNGVFVHNTLNSFHLAGTTSAKVIVGIPRFKEIIELNKSMKTPSMRLPMYPDVAGDEEARTLLSARLRRSLLHEYALRIAPFDVAGCTQHDVELVELCSIFDEEKVGDTTLMRLSDQGVTYSGVVLQITLDMTAMHQVRLYPCDIARAIEGAYDPKHLRCRWSPSTSITWKIIVEVMQPMQLLDMNTKTTTNSKSSTQETSLDGVRVKVCALLRNCVVSGPSQIQNTAVCEVRRLVVDRGTALVQQPELHIETSGSDLTGMMRVHGIDWARCSTNDVLDTYATLGIEAAVNVLKTEIKTAISQGGSTVDPRHIACIVNVMTVKGVVMPLSRHGINRTDYGVLCRASFEETAEVLKTAAATGCVDPAGGVSESIMLGKLASVGSGCCSIVDTRRSENNDQDECMMISSRYGSSRNKESGIQVQQIMQRKVSSRDTTTEVQMQHTRDVARKEAVARKWQCRQENGAFAPSTPARAQ